MSDRAIRDAILQITGNHLSDKVYAIDAVVISVDTTTRTCVCQAVSGRANNIFNDVRLMASADDGILIIPEIDSNVCIILSDYSEPYISQYGGIDRIILRGGDLGGLVKAAVLTVKLNNLEKLMNNLITKFNSHTHNVTAVGSPTGPNITPEGGSLTTTTQAELENKNISHG
jgi:hypothetical protein